MAVFVLDAYVPRPGESWFDLQPPGMAEAVRTEAGGSWLRPAGPPEALGVADPAAIAWMRARSVQQYLATNS